MEFVHMIKFEWLLCRNYRAVTYAQSSIKPWVEWVANFTLLTSWASRKENRLSIGQKLPMPQSRFEYSVKDILLVFLTMLCQLYRL